MTKKQYDLIKNMYQVLDTEFDFGHTGKKGKYTVQEASKLIWLNKDIYFGIVDEGQCTVKQYNQLTEIAGRQPKLPRHLIGFTQAIEWLEQYGKKVAK
jgi:hypothetical protein